MRIGAGSEGWFEQTGGSRRGADSAPGSDPVPASRTLVAIEPPVAREPPARFRQAAFLAQLIATYAQHPQTRARRRAEPNVAIAAYRAVAACTRG